MCLIIQILVALILWEILKLLMAKTREVKRRNK